MIDWLKLRLSVDARDKIPGDRVMIVSPDGEIKWQKIRALEVTGSYDANVHASSCPVSGRLVIDGNPVKFFQGHNVFGSGDIHGLADAISDHIGGKLGFNVAGCQESAEVARTDLTGMYSMATLANARAAVRAMGERATMRFRGRGQLGREGTAYWSKHSRRSAVKAYAKGHELLDHKLPKGLAHADAISAWAQDKLRIEVVLRGMELKQRGLDVLANWQENTAAELYGEFVARLNVPDNIELAPPVIETLKPRLRLAYNAWLHGEDLRAALPRKTFYRYRKELMAHGVDLLTLRPAEAKSNVLQLVRILEARPVSVPDWAIGTSAYFEPRARRAA